MINEFHLVSSKSDCAVPCCYLLMFSTKKFASKTSFKVSVRYCAADKNIPTAASGPRANRKSLILWPCAQGPRNGPERSRPSWQLLSEEGQG